METLLALAGILLACLISAMSPGPSFLFVARTAMSAAGPRTAYLRAKVAIGLAAGVVMGLLGIKLITAADNVV
jgi:hypothetical protein